MSAIQTVAKPLEGPVAISRPRLLSILTGITALGVIFGLYMALFFARTDVDQGDVQRIFYIHMPAFLGAFVAFSATVLGGVMYLRTRNAKWDKLALAGVEVGFVLGLVNLVTGMIWSRPIWNTWWTWDPRLTMSAIMTLTYAAYLMLRNGIDNLETRRRFASVYGILAIITVIMTLVIIRLRPDTIHPTVIGPSAGNGQGAFALSASAGVAAALGVNMPVWALLVPVTLMWHRIRLINLSERLSEAKAGLLSRNPAK
jgi:heme exporter protein C